MKLIALLLVMSAPLSARAEAGNDAVKSILEQLAARENNTPSLSMDLEINGTYAHPDKTDSLRSTAHCRRDGKRLDYVADDYSTFKGIETHLYSRRALWDGHHFIERESKYPDRVDHPDVFYAVGWSTRHLIQQPWTAPYMDGRIGKDLLQDLFANPHVARLAPPEVIDGVKCTVINANLGCGTCRLWIDTDRSFAFRKVTLHAEAAGDISEIVLSGVVLTHVGQTDIVTRAHIVSKTTSGDKLMFSSDVTATRKNIRLSPDFAKEGAFVMNPIPEGAAVYNLEIFSWREPEPTLVWKNGRAVSKEQWSVDVKSLAK